MAEAMLGVGVFWSLAGVLLTPTMKFYNNMLLVFLYLPALWLCLVRSREVGRLVLMRRELWVFLLLFGWASLSLFWTEGEFDRLVTFKRILLFALLVFGWVIWGRESERRLSLTLSAVVVVSGLYSVAALLWAPYHGHDRLSGFGGFLDNPNSVGYAVSFILVMAVPLMPQRLWARLLWGGLQISSFLYVVQSGSRGALLALTTCAIAGLLLVRGRLVKILFIVLVLGGVGALCLNPALIMRGDSERLALIGSALSVFSENPWMGLGLGTDYQVEGALGRFYDNPHNFLLHTAIQFGLPALLVWLLLWGMIGVHAWHCRERALGKSLLLLWIFSSVAMQFDVFSLWERSRAIWMMPWGVFLLCLCLSRDLVEKRPEREHLAG